MKLTACCSAVILGWAVPALAQTPTTPPLEAPKPPAPPLFTFAFRGILSATVFVQDAIAGPTPGHGAFFAVARPDTDRLIFSGDVRQTRLNFSIRGPEVLGGATPTGLAEVDFLGGYSAGQLGDESPLPRLRLGYVEAAWKNTTLRVGQTHNLIIGFVPASAAHMALTYGYGAGFVGWRSPGATLLRRVPLTGMNLELGLQVNRNSWNDNIGAGQGQVPICTSTQSPPTDNCIPFGVSAGETGTPQVEARVALSSGTRASPWPTYPNVDWMVFVAGHLDRKDLSGVGFSPGGEGDTLDTLAVQGGAKAFIGPVHLAVHGWAGRNTGNLLGNINQTPLILKAPDVFGWAAFVQAGLMLTQELSLWGYAGTEQLDKEEAVAAGFARRGNATFAGMLSYKEGAYAATLEWIHWRTDYGSDSGIHTVPANQVAASVSYFF